MKDSNEKFLRKGYLYIKRKIVNDSNFPEMQISTAIFLENVNGNEIIIDSDIFKKMNDFDLINTEEVGAFIYKQNYRGLPENFDKYDIYYCEEKEMYVFKYEVKKDIYDFIFFDLRKYLLENFRHIIFNEKESYKSPYCRNCSYREFAEIHNSEYHKDRGLGFDSFVNKRRS